MTSSLPIDARLHQAARQLLIGRLAGSDDPPAAARGVVTEQDAVDAALTLLAAIEEQAQMSRITPHTANRMAALLMVIRDRVRPLPEGIAADGCDLLTTDLAAMVEAVRLAR